MTRDFSFSLGDLVEEKITGFTGTITGCAFYLTGCAQFLVVPRGEDPTKKTEGLWYDEGRLKLVKAANTTEEEVSADDNGADIDAPNKG